MKRRSSIRSRRSLAPRRQAATLDVDAVLFDLGGTLDAPGTDWNTRFFRLFHAAGLRMSFPRFAAISDATLASFASRPEVHGWRLAPAIAHNVAAMAERLRLPPSATKRIAPRMVADLTRWARRSKPVLQALKRRGYRIGVISNNVGNTVPVLRDHGLLALFDTVVDSTLEGVRKPDPEIFRRTLRRIQVAAERAAYVGDRFDLDVQASKAVGMKGIWLVGREKKRCPDPSFPDATIRSLSDLLPLLPHRSSSRR